MHAAAFTTGLTGTPTPVAPSLGAGQGLDGLQSAEWLAAAQHGQQLTHSDQPQFILALAACHAYSTVVAQSQPQVSLIPITSAPKPITTDELVAAFATHLAALSAAPEMLAGQGATKTDREAGFEAIKQVEWFTSRLRSDVTAAGLSEIPESMAALVVPRPTTVAQLREAYGNTASRIVATYGRWILSEPNKAVELANQMSTWQKRAVEWGQTLPTWPGWAPDSAP